MDKVRRITKRFIATLMAVMLALTLATYTGCNVATVEASDRPVSFADCGNRCGMPA